MCLNRAHDNLKKDKRKRKHHRPANLVSSFSMVITNMILPEGLWTVQSYLEDFIDGCPNHLRPMVCPHCEAKVMLHKHGSFKRTVYTLLEEFVIAIYRFICPINTCKQSISLVPNFVPKYHQVAWEVKEEVIRQQLSGVALMKISEDMVISAGKFSEKTLWRWSKAIRDKLRESSSEQWQVILEKLPHLEIHVGPEKPLREWGWLFRAWEQVRLMIPDYVEIGLLAWLYWHKRSRAVAPG